MTSPIALQNEVTEFFEAFNKAFLQFNGPLIAQRFIAPYLSLDAAGTLQHFCTQEQIRDYFQVILDSYYLRGCRACRFRELEVIALGSASAIASTTWELLDDNEKVLSSWRESYNLVRSNEGLRIFASVDHAL